MDADHRAKHKISGDDDNDNQWDDPANIPLQLRHEHRSLLQIGKSSIQDLFSTEQGALCVSCGNELSVFPLPLTESKREILFFQGLSYIYPKSTPFSLAELARFNLFSSSLAERDSFESQARPYADDLSRTFSSRIWANHAHEMSKRIWFNHAHNMPERCPGFTSVCYLH